MRPPPPRGHQARLLGAVGCFASAVLAAFGSSLPLFTSHVKRLGTTQLTLTFNGWGFDVRAADPSVPTSKVGTFAINGAPLMFAAMALLAAALLGLIARYLPPGAGIRRASGITAAVGAAFLAGTVWTIGMQVLAWADSFRPTGAAAGNPDFSAGTTLSVGFWLLIAATVLAIAGAVLAWLPLRGGGQAVVVPPPYGPGWDRVEPVTPSIGMPVVAQPPASPSPRPPEPESAGH